MIQWLLDPNACIAIMNDRPSGVRSRLTEHAVADVAMSAIILYELQYGVAKSGKIEQNRKTLDAFLKYIRVLEWTEDCANAAGQLRADLEQSRSLIGPYDLLIAAHALTADATLVARNTREFSRVKDLRLVDRAT